MLVRATLIYLMLLLSFGAILGLWTDRNMDFWVSHFKGVDTDVPFWISWILSTIFNAFALAANVVAEVIRYVIA